MKHFNLKRLVEWTRNQKLLYYKFIVALVVPNIVLVFTEETSFFGRVCNIVFPVAMFWFLMSLARKPGKALWLMFWFVFLDAFQLVLLYLFGNSIIAVDMFLNLLTTNSGEAGGALARVIIGGGVFVGGGVYFCISEAPSPSAPRAATSLQRGRQDLQIGHPADGCRAALEGHDAGSADLQNVVFLH